VSNQLTTLKLTSEQQELTIAGLRATLAAKEKEESKLVERSKELDSCKNEHKMVLKDLEKKKETEQIFEQKQQALQAENEVFLCI
jgi:hypothetical protein